MKLRKMNHKYWEIIQKKGKLLSHRLWTISIICPGEIYKWAFIKEFSYLYNKEFYTHKIYEDRKGNYKEEIFKHNKKEQYQTYIRGLRRNIKLNYPGTVYIIEEEYLGSEEGAI